MAANETTRPNRETREAERREARTPPGPGPEPEASDEDAADEHETDEDVREHYEEMTERGAHQKGEGRVP